MTIWAMPGTTRKAAMAAIPATGTAAKTVLAEARPTVISVLRDRDS
jgi:hypothetical protein